jgi:hypothetical protein
MAVVRASPNNEGYAKPKTYCGRYAARLVDDHCRLSTIDPHAAIDDPTATTY